MIELDKEANRCRLAEITIIILSIILPLMFW